MKLRLTHRSTLKDWEGDARRDEYQREEDILSPSEDERKGKEWQSQNKGTKILRQAEKHNEEEIRTEP